MGREGILAALGIGLELSSGLQPRQTEVCAEIIAWEHFKQSLLPVAVSQSRVPFLCSLERWILRLEIVERVRVQPGIGQVREVRLLLERSCEQA